MQASYTRFTAGLSRGVPETQNEHAGSSQAAEGCAHALCKLYSFLHVQAELLDLSANPRQ
jgi:hypothetical protein